MSLCSIADDSCLRLPSLPQVPSHCLLIETKQLLPATSALFIDHPPPPSLSHLEEEASIELDLKSSQEREVVPGETRRKKTGCNCKKTKCLKLYCQCFAAGRACTPDCNCHGCHNQDPASERVKRAQEAIRTKTSGGRKKRQAGCRCSKTRCQKKYCQCFNAGVACTPACKCTDCENGPYETHSHSPSEMLPEPQLVKEEEEQIQEVPEAQSVQQFKSFKPFQSISELLG